MTTKTTFTISSFSYYQKCSRVIKDKKSKHELFSSLVLLCSSSSFEWHWIQMSSVRKLKLIFSNEDERSKPQDPTRAEISKRLSRSMERWLKQLFTSRNNFVDIFSVESIVHHLSQFGEPPSAISEEKAEASPKVLRRVSSSHNVLRHLRNVSQIHLMIIMMMSWFRSERRSASMSNIDAEDLKKFNIELEKDLRRLHNKIPPPNKISENDIYIRHVPSNVLRFYFFLYQGSSAGSMEGLQKWFWKNILSQHRVTEIKLETSSEIQTT